jgi:hypothetical protein
MTKMLPGWGSRWREGRREGGKEEGMVRRRRKQNQAQTFLTNSSTEVRSIYTYPHMYVPPCKNPSPNTILENASVKLANSLLENTAASGEPSAIPLSTIFSFSLVKGVP